MGRGCARSWYVVCMQTSPAISVVAINSAHELMPEAYYLRHEVFVVEQSIAQELERDEDDDAATHLVALLDGRVVGTLRIVPHGRIAKIERMAVAASLRKIGIGRQLMEFAARTAERLGYAEEGPV